MSNESNDGSLTKNEHRSLDFKLIVDDVKSGKQVKVRYSQSVFLFSLSYDFLPFVFKFSGLWVTKIAFSADNSDGN